MVCMGFAISGGDGETRMEARIVDIHRERDVGTIMVRAKHGLQGGQTQTQTQTNIPRWWASRYATENAVCSYPSAACLLGGFSESDVRFSRSCAVLYVPREAPFFVDWSCFEDMVWSWGCSNLQCVSQYLSSHFRRPRVRGAN